jgi:hypothetical protein
LSDATGSQVFGANAKIPSKCIVLLLPKSKRGLIIFINSENGLVIWKKIIEEYLDELGKEIVRRNLE